MLGFDDLYPPQEWVHVEGIHGRRYRNYAHFALPPSRTEGRNRKLIVLRTPLVHRLNSPTWATCKACGDTYKTINGRLMVRPPRFFSCFLPNLPFARYS